MLILCHIHETSEALILHLIQNADKCVSIDLYVKFIHFTRILNLEKYVQGVSRKPKIWHKRIKE